MEYSEEDLEVGDYTVKIAKEITLQLSMDWPFENIELTFLDICYLVALIINKWETCKAYDLTTGELPKRLETPGILENDDEEETDSLGGEDSE